MYQEAADAAKATAEEQATGAGMNYMTAMEAAAAAETAAGTHVLGLFTSANAYDVKDDDDAEEEVASVGAAIAAAAMATAGAQAGTATATAAWDVDKPDDATPDVDEAVPGLLKITFDFHGWLVALMSSRPTQWAMTTPTPAVKPNAKQTNVGGDFPHLFDMSSGGARVLVFTDKEQETPEVVAVTAVTITNAVVTAEQITSVGEFSGTSFQGTFDHTDADIPAIKGTFTCTDSPCSLVTTGSGDDVMVTTATGYTFSGRREGVTAVEAAAKADYLLFGVWLDEKLTTMRAPIPSGPSQRVDSRSPRPTWTALEGTATYSGPAVGAHHKTGSGVSSFDGDANLTADFATLTPLLEPSRARSITSPWVAATPWRSLSIW